MRNIFITIVLAVLLLSPIADGKIFVGKILYKHSFTDLKGNDITSRLAPVFGLEQHYYIDRENYKALDELNNWKQLYNSKSNTYFYFSDKKSVQKLDASVQSAQKIKVTRLNKQEKDAGYICSGLQIEKGNTTTIYYYSPLVKTEVKVFSKHNLGEWNQYLEATEGALPLKFVMTNHKDSYVWTAVATQVSKMKLMEKDFEFPEGYKLQD